MADLITDQDVATAMRELGGSFSSALARAWLLGDDVNRQKIQAAFPEIWATHHELVTLRRQREAKA